MSDVLRRLVVRTMAKQCSKSAEAATAPFQCALQTRAGSERFARAPDTERSGPQRDKSVRGRGWRVRFDFEDGRRRQDASGCEAVPQRSVSVLVGGTWW